MATNNAAELNTPETVDTSVDTSVDSSIETEWAIVEAKTDLEVLSASQNLQNLKSEISQWTQNAGWSIDWNTWNETQAQSKIEEKSEEVSQNNEVSWDTQTSDVVTESTDSVETESLSIDEEIQKLLDWFKEFKTPWPKAPKLWESKNTKSRLKQVVKDDIQYLKNMEKELWKYNYIYNPEVFVSDINQLNDHKEKLERVRQIITKWWNTTEIPWIIASLKDVKRAKKFENKMSNLNLEMNTLLKDATLLKLWNKDAEWLQNYLIWVRSGEIEHPSQDEFFRNYQKDFEEIEKTDPELYVKITTKKQKASKYTVSHTPTWYIVCWNAPQTYSKKESFANKWWKAVADILEKLWVNAEWDPRKRAAREKAWSLLAIWWAIVLWFSFFKNLFSKQSENENKRRKVAWYGAGLLALLNIGWVEQWFKDVSWSSSGEVANNMNNVLTQTWMNSNEISEEMQSYVNAPLTVMTALSFIPINTLISEWIVSDTPGTGTLKFNFDKYMLYINTILPDTPENAVERKNLIESARKINETEWMLSSGLSAIWVNKMDDLKVMWANDDTLTLKGSPTVAANFANHIERVWSGVNAVLYRENLKPKDATSREKIVHEYDESKWNTQIIKWMKDWLIETKWTPRYTAEQVKILSTNPNINMEWKSLYGLSLSFGSYDELFRVHQLTSYIKEQFKNKPAKSLNPFENTISWIEFNDTKWWQIWKNETDVIKWHIFNNEIKDISNTLNKHRKEYVNFLNEWWNREVHLIES